MEKVRKFIGYQEVSQLTGYKVSTLKKMVSQGKIPCYKSDVFKTTYFDEDEILRLRTNVRITTQSEMISAHA